MTKGRLRRKGHRGGRQVTEDQGLNLWAQLWRKQKQPELGKELSVGDDWPLGRRDY